MKKRLISESFHLLVTYIALQWREYVQCGLWRSSHGNIPQSPCSSCTHEQVHKSQPWDQRTISSDHTPGITTRQGKEVCLRWRNSMSDVTERENAHLVITKSLTHPKRWDIHVLSHVYTTTHMCSHSNGCSNCLHIQTAVGPCSHRRVCGHMWTHVQGRRSSILNICMDTYSLCCPVHSIV